MTQIHSGQVAECSNCSRRIVFLAGPRVWVHDHNGRVECAPPIQYATPRPRTETKRPCPECGLPQEIPGEGRFCGACQDYEGHCANDHCMTCGADT